MGIKDKFEEQQRQRYNDQELTSETLSALFDRLDGIEKNQQEIVNSFNSVAQNFLSTWEGMEQMQRSMQQQTLSDASVNDSHAKAMTTLATTQSEILELLAGSKVVQLPNGSTVTAADVSAHALMQTVSAQIQSLETTNLKLGDEVHRKSGININHEKLAGYLVPGLGEQISAYQGTVREAFAEATIPVLTELETTRTALDDAGLRVSAQVKQASKQVEKLTGVMTWRAVGQVATVLLPLSLVVFVVFGTAQTVWAAFGLQPILQTVWGWFLSTPEWYWKLAIAGCAFAILAAICWLTWWFGKKIHQGYRGW